MGTVVGTWRLKLIIILIIFVTSIYFTGAIFSNTAVMGPIDEDGYIDYTNPDISNLDYNNSTAGVGVDQSFIDVLGGFGDFMTFGFIDNIWIRAFFNVIMLFVYITISYVVATFIKEYIPFT